MTDTQRYTTQLQAGLGLIEETKLLLDIWEPGMTASALLETTLDTGRLPGVTARRLRNIVMECFAPRYLAREVVALNLKILKTKLSQGDLEQLFLLYTCRANLILLDFIKDIYWQRYSSGRTEISNDDSQAFVRQAVDQGKTQKRWAETTIRRVSAYLTGCCADYGLLEKGMKSVRRISPFRISQPVATYLAYDLHFSGKSDQNMINSPEWGIFGCEAPEVRDELKRLALKGFLLVQTGADLVQISWKYKNMEELCNVLD